MSDKKTDIEKLAELKAEQAKTIRALEDKLKKEEAARLKRQAIAKAKKDARDKGRVMEMFNRKHMAKQLVGIAAGVAKMLLANKAGDREMKVAQALIDYVTPPKPKKKPESKED